MIESQMESNIFEERKKRVNKFGGRLEQVCRAALSSETSDAVRAENPRAVLAALRRGLSGREESRGPMWEYVAPYLGEREHASDRWFFVVGALAGWHPQTGAPAFQSLGGAARILRGQSESMTMHFAALLACDERDLPNHLRHISALLAAQKTPVNWLQLLHDLALTGWNHPERKVQSRWARDFYQD